MAIRQSPKYANVRGSIVVTPPTTECVSLRELKQHLRIPVGMEDDDLYLGQLIIDATTWIEEQANFALISQGLKITLDCWPGYHEAWWDGVRQMPVTELQTAARARVVEIPRYPLISVDTVTVYDEDSNATAVVIADVFDVDAVSRPGRLSLKRGATWPIATRSVNAIEIDYTAGYGTSANDVPAPLRRAVLENAAYLYTHRGDCTPGEAYAKSGAMNIINTYRVRQL